MSPEIRRPALRAALLLLLPAFFLAYLPACSDLSGDTDHGRRSAVFVRAGDGDSLVLRVDGRKRRVRLIGVDCPEKGQPWGGAAVRFTREFCSRGRLTLEYDRQRTDRYGRTLAYVYTREGMLNRALVRGGLALSILVRPNGRYHDVLDRDQREARATGAGFWAGGGLDMTPWQWRERHPRAR